MWSVVYKRSYQFTYAMEVSIKVLDGVADKAGMIQWLVKHAEANSHKDDRDESDDFIVDVLVNCLANSYWDREDIVPASNDLKASVMDDDLVAIIQDWLDEAGQFVERQQEECDAFGRAQSCAADLEDALDELIRIRASPNYLRQIDEDASPISMARILAAQERMLMRTVMDYINNERLAIKDIHAVIGEDYQELIDEVWEADYDAE